MEQRIATIQDANFGLRDFGREPGLWFTASYDGSMCVILAWGWNESKAIIQQAKVWGISDLNGRKCVIEGEQFDSWRFVRFLPVEAQ